MKSMGIPRRQRRGALTEKTKGVIAILGMVALLSVGGLIGLDDLTDLKNMTVVLVSDFESVQACGAMRNGLNLLRRSELRYVMASQKLGSFGAAQELESDGFFKLESGMRQYAADGLITSPKEQAIYGDFKDRLEKYLAFRSETVSLAKAGKGREVLSRESDSAELFALTYEAMDADITHNYTNARARVRKAYQEYYKGVVAVASAIVAASVFGAFFMSSLFRREAKLTELSLTDQMTGLSNRRGFLHLAQQQIKTAVRDKKELALFFADVDGLKKINDSFGHAEGDRAIIDAATILEKTFRTSDIVARLGGDEFVILAHILAAGGSEVITSRLEQNIREHNLCVERPYTLSICFGVVTCDPARQVQLEELLAEGDRLMYERKRAARQS